MRKLDGRDAEDGNKTYGEFARAPETFNYTELIDCHCSEEKGGRVCVTALKFGQENLELVRAR